MKRPWSLSEIQLLVPLDGKCVQEKSGGYRFLPHNGKPLEATKGGLIAPVFAYEIRDTRHGWFENFSPDEITEEVFADMCCYWPKYTDLGSMGPLAERKKTNGNGVPIPPYPAKGIDLWRVGIYPGAPFFVSQEGRAFPNINLGQRLSAARAKIAAALGLASKKTDRDGNPLLYLIPSMSIEDAVIFVNWKNERIIKKEESSRAQEQAIDKELDDDIPPPGHAQNLRKGQ